MAVSTISNRIKRKGINGSTNAGGNIAVGDSNMIVVGTRATGNATQMFIPFTSHSVCYLKVLNWNVNSYTPYANASVAVEISYIEI